MMNLVLLFVVIAGTLLSVLVTIGFFVIKRAKHREQRERLIQLASAAAADESGAAFIALLDALEVEANNCPVKVKWLPHDSARNPVPSVLVTISWDGNEWRRVSPIEVLYQQIESVDTENHSRLARQFRNDLRGYAAAMS